jgi:dihydropyrimidinase
MDLVVRSGAVVTAGGCTVADVGVEDGRIVQIGGRMQAAEVIDADGQLVLPGGVDMHVHLSPALVAEGDFWWADDFASGSRAAAAGGVTTVGNITFPVRDEPVLDALRRTAAEAQAASLADFVLHPVITTAPADPESLTSALAAAGGVSVKIFTNMAGFAADPAGYIGLIAAAARQQLTVLAHCEDRALGEHLGGPEQPDAARARPYYPAAAIEVAAVARMLEIGGVTAARLYLVHLASARSVQLAVAARGGGVNVRVETRPEYLTLTDDDLAAARGQEPGTGGRGPAELAALWQAVSAGHVDAICTDHAPWGRRPGTASAGRAASVRSGLSSLEVARSLLFDRGVRGGKITIEQLAELTAAGPARAFGLYPAKGVIAVGSDADLAVFDPAEQWTFTGGQSAAEWTAFHGWQLTGRVTATIRRGSVIYRRPDGFADGGGQWLRRRASPYSQADEQAQPPARE